LPAANELSWTFDEIDPLYGGYIDSIRFPTLGYPAGRRNGAIRWSTGCYRLEPEIFPPAPCTWLVAVEALKALQEVPHHLIATLRGHEECYALNIADEFGASAWPQSEVNWNQREIFLFLRD